MPAAPVQVFWPPPAPPPGSLHTFAYPPLLHSLPIRNWPSHAFDPLADLHQFDDPALQELPTDPLLDVHVFADEPGVVEKQLLPEVGHGPVHVLPTRIPPLQTFVAVVVQLFAGVAPFGVQVVLPEVHVPG